MEENKENDNTVIKMLLSAPVSSTQDPVMVSSPPLNLGPLYVSNSPSIPSPVSDMGDESQHKLTNYFQQLSGATISETEIDVVQLDHNYAKPWNWRPETSFIRPSKILFPTNKTAPNSQLLQCNDDNEEEIDVTAEDPPPPMPMYDAEKARRLMEECENHAKAARLYDNDEWEDTLIKDTWSASQHKIFSKMLRILQMDRLGRLVYASHVNEPILRRAIIDKSVKRFRHLLSSFYWETKLIQWLHLLIVENINGTYLTSYLDILQTLRNKVPLLVDKLMFSPNSNTKIGLTSNENLFPLLKRAWDPVGQFLSIHKPKKLPGNPIILIVPSSPNFRSTQSKRLLNWVSLFSNLGMVVVVQTSLGNVGGRMTMTNCLDQMVIATRAKLQEIRTDCPNRPVILVGFNSAGAVACQVADMEAVTAVVSLGFPLHTVEGSRGEPDDMLMELQVPVLFVIGQCALTASPSEMEELREHMRVETGLIIVGSADDYLRVSMKKRREDGITQSMVDRCIMNEIGDFIGSILMSPHPPQKRQSPVYMGVSNSNEPIPKKSKVAIRRRTSTGSETVDSEPASPQPKKTTRPVGRPPKDGKYSKVVKPKIPTYQESNQWNQKDIVSSSNSSSITESSSTVNNSINNSSDSSQTFPSTSPLFQESTLPRPISKPPNMMRNNPIVKSVSKILSTADALRQSNTIDTVNEAVANILPSSAPTFNPTKMNVPMRQVSTAAPPLSTLLHNTSSAGVSRYTIASTVTTSASSNNVTSIGGIRVLGNSEKMVILGDNMRGRINDQNNVLNNFRGMGIAPPGSITLRATQSGGNVITTLPLDTKSPTQVKYISKPSAIIRSPMQSKLGVPAVPMRKQVFTTKPRYRTSPLKQNVNEAIISGPADLSEADILDIPIIFADNNGTLLPSSNLTGNTTPITTCSTPMTNVTAKPPVYNKVVLINKQQTNIQGGIKIPTTSSQQIMKPTVQRVGMNVPPLKYSKVLLTKRSSPSEINKPVPNTFISVAPTTVRNTDSSVIEHVDFEQQIKETKIERTIKTAVVNAQVIKNKPELKTISGTKIISNVPFAKQNTFFMNKTVTVGNNLIQNTNVTNDKSPQITVTTNN